MTALNELLATPAPIEVPAAPPVREDAETLTPNGTRIEFKTKPHRHYLIDGQRVCSVTQVLGVIDKPALKWWGMKIGVAGVVELARRNVVPAGMIATADPASLVSLLTTEKLTVNHVRKEAADRGTRVHDALERWATTNEMPDPAKFVEAERGYIEALLAFIREVRPIPGGVEQIVGSKTHAFAGRGDLLRAVVPNPVEVPLRKTVKEKGRRAERVWTTELLPAGSYLLDAKTSVDVFDEAMLQVEAYEGAAVEGGLPATDHRAVVRFGEDGRYELVRSVATFDEFLAALQLYNALERLRDRRAA